MSIKGLIPLLFGLSLGQPTADLVTNLPGLTFNVSYAQYSGYLDLDNGHHLHYWLQESQNDPANDPVVLWLNGGPGCSSLDGLLYEMGAIHVYDNGSLWDNKYSWNLKANMIYLEAPICVGFSYTDDGNCVANDNSTATDNYNALLKFFEKFPKFVSNDFYVTGESYAGTYVPTLTYNIVVGNQNTQNTKINLKGFAVGNGVSSGDGNDDASNSRYWYYYHHGFISDQVWSEMLEACCKSPYDRYSCDFVHRSSACSTAIGKTNGMYGSDLDPYNIYGSCFHNAEEKQKLDEQGLLYSHDKLMHELKHTNHDLYEQLKGVPPCTDAVGATTWLNRADVRSALHISSKAQTWSICSNTLHYSHTVSNLANYYKGIFNMDSSVWSTVYNGDTDTVCNFLGDEWFVEDLGYKALDSWREWYYESANDGTQVGGWTKDYNRIRFVTVRGAGHMVPQYRPAAALKMFEYFIQNKDL